MSMAAAGNDLEKTMTMRPTRRLGWACAIAIALAAGAPARAGDGPPQPWQTVQMAQSALELLGYYDGELHGKMDPATHDALERFVIDSHYAGGYDQVNIALLTLLAIEVGPALEASFGTDPTGTWDVDLSGLSAEDRRDLMDLHQWESLDLCSSPLAIQFRGMTSSYWLYGSPTIYALRDGALEPLPDPDFPDAPRPAFRLIDADTMQRTVDGAIETWHRCD